MGKEKDGRQMSGIGMDASDDPMTKHQKLSAPRHKGVVLYGTMTTEAG